MWHTIRSFLESHFSLLMGLGLVGGLLTPVPGMLPDYVPPAILAVMMGFSYSKIKLADIMKIRIREILGFYVFRFLLIPFLGYAFFKFALPDYSYAVLLLLLLPVAVSGAALAALLGGNVALALAATVLSSLIAPFLIPLVFELVEYRVEFDTVSMFLTLGAIVFIPALVYFGGIRWFAGPKKIVQDNASLASVVLFGLFILVVVSRLRDEILADPAALIAPFLILGAVFAFMYALGWIVFLRADRETRIAYTIFSGANNMGLGVSIALLYFTAEDNLRIIICEFLWVIALGGFQFFLKRVKH